jgi:hypothetical protein
MNELSQSGVQRDAATRATDLYNDAKRLYEDGNHARYYQQIELIAQLVVIAGDKW